VKAVFFEQHGWIEQLQYGDRPDPVPGPGQALIRVKAASLNGLDLRVLRGVPAMETALPHIPCADFAGEIVQLGTEVNKSEWRIGDRVIADPYKPGVGSLGEELRGVASEFIALDTDWLMHIPAEVSDIDAASLPTAYGTALRMLESRGEVQPGETVLIIGASGGVGTSCVQLAKRIGATVVATTGSPDKAPRLKELGADHVIDTNKEDFVTVAHGLFGRPRDRKGIDVVVNYVGGATWRPSLRVVRPRGRILTCGASAGHDPQEDLRYVWTFEIDIRGCNAWHAQDIGRILESVAGGKIRPVIDSVLPFARIRDAFELLAQRKAFGKVILVP
jgi:alcohol dehydrogenase